MLDQDSSSTSRSGTSPQLRLAMAVVAVVVTVVLVVFALRVGAKTARRKALEHMSKCEFTPAQRCLAWSAWFASGDYVTDLLQAACYRQLRQTAAWEKSLEEAARKRAPQDRVIAERKLDHLRRGGSYSAKQDVQAEMDRLYRAGVSASDLLTTLVLGYLAAKDAASAKVLLDTMPADSASAAHQEYLWGAYLQGEDAAAAEVRFRNALKAQPTHELAHAALADLLEQTYELDRALQANAEFAACCEGSAAATLGLARVLRKLGRVEQSRAVLARFAADPDPLLPIQREMAQIAVEAGRGEEAERRFLEVLREETADPDILFPAAQTFLLQAKLLDARRLCTKVVDWERRYSWLLELRTRVGSKPGDAASAEELKQEIARLNRPSGAPSRGTEGDARQRTAQDSADPSAAAAAELYRFHCSACHGVRGDGQGLAAGLLFPRPRNLRSGRCRLVSTLNGVPTLEDVQRVLTLGMPGASMQSFQDLPEPDRGLLAKEVLRLRQEGAREEATRAFGQEGEEVDEAEIRQAVERSTAPGEPVRPPSPWPTLPQAAAKGRVLYTALGCNKCHGDDGIGTVDSMLFDDQGEPSRPRDLVHEPFKGGREPEAIYARIVAGMPGTAHPAVLGLPQDQLIALVEYVRSLAQQPQQVLGNHERRLWAAARAYLEWRSKSSAESSTRRQ